MEDKIDVKKFVDARSNEIAEIEKSIAKKNTRLAPFQKLPHYLRRRNHSFEPRAHRFKSRTRNRFMLKTHVYFAKRFRMLKIIEAKAHEKSFKKLSIPWERNVKSGALLRKAFNIGFALDESYRKVEELKATSLPPEQAKILKGLKDLSYVTVNNSYEYARIDGKMYKFSFTNKIKEMGRNALFKLYGVNGDFFNKIKTVATKHNARLVRNTEKAMDDYIIFGNRKDTMELLLGLSRIQVRIITIRELEQIALDRDSLTIYDNVTTCFYKAIDNKINKDVSEKYNRTPPAKRNKLDLNKLKLHQENSVTYFTFKLVKGKVERSAEILEDGEVVGKVVRAGYKHKNGCVFGLGYFYMPPLNRSNLKIRILGHQNTHELSVTKQF